MLAVLVPLLLLIAAEAVDSEKVLYFLADLVVRTRDLGIARERDAGEGSFLVDREGRGVARREELRHADSGEGSVRELDSIEDEARSCTEEWEMSATTRVCSDGDRSGPRRHVSSVGLWRCGRAFGRTSGGRAQLHSTGRVFVIVVG